MSIFHLLNAADYVFMAAGLGIALLMIGMGGSEERRKSDRLGSPDAEVPVKTEARRQRRH